MKNLSDYKEEIHSCSKCGLCQSVCPVYKITGNDCTVSRGHFIMLKGLINNELKMSKTINRYLDLCLKCGACSKFCPSGIDAVNIITAAKAEYFKLHKREKFKSFILKILISFIHSINKLCSKNKSKTFNKKVIYFAGCEGISKEVVKILNTLKIEVITPNFNCCGFPFFAQGDFETFKQYADKFYKELSKFGEYDIVTNCATCEKALKSYSKLFENEHTKDLKVKNVFEYIRENNLKLKLKKVQKVTFHKPCNMDNYDDIIWILNNTKNLKYTEMIDFDKCCGGSGLLNIKNFKIISELPKEKHNNIKQTGVKTVLTSCLACRINLKLFSKNSYKVQDLAEFLAKHSA